MPKYIDIKETGLKARNYRHLMVRREVKSRWRSDLQRFKRRNASSQNAVSTGLLSSLLLYGLLSWSSVNLTSSQSLFPTTALLLEPLTLSILYFFSFLCYHWIKKTFKG